MLSLTKTATPSQVTGFESKENDFGALSAAKLSKSAAQVEEPQILQRPDVDAGLTPMAKAVEDEARSG